MRGISSDLGNYFLFFPLWRDRVPDTFTSDFVKWLSRFIIDRIYDLLENWTFSPARLA
jgi:hypothetical protein